ncbi:Sulfotransferase 1C2 [Armadillidium nasatum]|uniref:Sulfotransferase 1C2 n=1 Tax=Armadillidium nasatum TaxID=96803 RepID=A0A5N5TF44_9CRUS|nr:Sulfotransferase 1C2 [Armadillidium nasatum]
MPVLRHWIIDIPFFDIDYGFAISSSLKFNPEGDLVRRFKKLCPGKDYNEGLLIHTAAALPDPRLLKGHMPLPFWPPNILDKAKLYMPLPFWPPNILDKAKVMYLARDPRDVVVSCYHFFQSSKQTRVTATLDEFVEDFMDDIILSAYWEHVRLAWEKRNNPNFLFLFYEDLKENPNEEIKKVDQFIGTNRSQNQIENVANYTGFNSMKEKYKDNIPVSFDKIYYDDSKTDKENGFFRKGKVGSWKEDLPLHLQEKMNSWMKFNLSQFSEDFKYKKEQFS